MVRSVSGEVIFDPERGRKAIAQERVLSSITHGRQGENVTTGRNAARPLPQWTRLGSGHRRYR
jgi:hypothetical protein